MLLPLFQNIQKSNYIQMVFLGIELKLHLKSNSCHSHTQLLLTVKGESRE